jgi:hypothetical protein
MPFGVVKRGNKFQVVNTETGDVKGEHATHSDADKQLAALHANDADKDKGHMDIQTKAVNATIEDTSANADEFPGTFLVELSNESLDRDGDELKADEWETPLPQQITFVNDHTHKMANVVGSATPELVGGKIMCKGEWAATDTAQDTRKVIKHVPYVSVAYREKRDQKAGTVSRELVNGSFVVVPSNVKARVLASKSVDDDTLLSDLTVKQFTELLGGQQDSRPEVQKHYDALAKMGYHVTLKRDGNTIEVKELSQAPEGAPPKGADPQADPAEDEAAALAKAKAAAFQITSQSRQYTETELNNA